MKIGILTFHCAHNYGTVLQAYALQEFLKSQGHTVSILDYRPEYILHLYKVFTLKKKKNASWLVYFKSVVSRLLTLSIRKKRFKAFDTFITERMQLSSPLFDVADSAFDAYVFGSDQIWNPIICHGFDERFFGDFKAARGKKRIAYAASMSAFKLDDYQVGYYRDKLQHLDCIGVREESLKDLLTPLTDKPISVVIDPTLLVGSEVFNPIAVAPKRERKYVLVYQINKNKHAFELAHKIAKEQDADVVEIVASWLDYRTSPNKIQCASPEEFLGYIKHACFVITTSFHGTVFSVLFEKPFYTLKVHSGADARAASLLESLGLSNRFIDGTALPEKYLTMNVEEVSGRLAELRKSSYSFLESSLTDQKKKSI
ncbi:MAG: polysaccharide pyruvyl transferase family protein [Bacteroidaceae bacterium]|nr:polysaccharide pyruvyl transferase family protein [Bacteroidaceae bacterium]